MHEQHTAAETWSGSNKALISRFILAVLYLVYLLSSISGRPRTSQCPAARSPSWYAVSAQISSRGRLSWHAAVAIQSIRFATGEVEQVQAAHDEHAQAPGQDAVWAKPQPSVEEMRARLAVLLSGARRDTNAR